MFGIFFENVESEYNWEKITYFPFKSFPHFFLLEGHALKLFSFEHSNRWYKFGHSKIRRMVFPLLSHWNPFVSLSFLFSTHNHLLPVGGQPHSRVIDDVLLILAIISHTNSTSSQQSKCKWCKTALGNVCRTGYSGLFFMKSRCVMVWSTNSSGFTMIKILRSLFACLLFHLAKLFFSLMVQFCKLPIFGAIVDVQIHQLLILK